MRPTQILRSEDPLWVNTASVATPERGIITYALSSDRQNILAGADCRRCATRGAGSRGRCCFGRRRWWRLGMRWSGLTRETST
ncbi:ubiquinol-cytochrome c reductase complex ubiquinone-binding protein [Apiospora arundinis]